MRYCARLLEEEGFTLQDIILAKQAVFREQLVDLNEVLSGDKDMDLKVLRALAGRCLSWAEVYGITAGVAIDRFWQNCIVWGIKHIMSLSSRSHLAEV